MPAPSAKHWNAATAWTSATLYTRTYALAEVRGGKPLPRAMIPSIRLDSPKFTRKLTTAWFAERVNARYHRCMRQ